MAASKQTAPKTDQRRAKTDAVALLVADRKEVKELFEQYDALVEGEAGADERQDLLDEAQVEHDSARDLIAQIGQMDPAEDLFDAKVKVLGEYIAHHVKEEEDELFPKVKRAKLDLASVGEELSARKQQLLAEADAEQDG